MQPDTSKPILLVVEDDFEVRETITSSLFDVTATIMTADNGKDGFEKILQFNPQAVLTDISMPMMTGLEMIREVRQAGKETPIIVLSGFGDRNNTTEALRLGAMDFLHKPFDIDELNLVVNMALALGVQMNSFEKTWEKYLADHPELTAVNKELVDKKRELLKMRLLAHPPKRTV
jgi:YesN/AraC family two-component response regulator